MQLHRVILSPEHIPVVATLLGTALPVVQQLLSTPIATAVTAAAELSPAQLKVDPSAAPSPDLMAQMRSDYLQLISVAQDVQVALSYAQHRDMVRAFDELDVARGGRKQAAGSGAAEEVAGAHPAEQQLRQVADAVAAAGAKAKDVGRIKTIAGGVQLCAYTMMPFPAPWPTGGYRRLTCADIRGGKLPLPYIAYITATTSHQFLPTAPGDSSAGRSVGATLAADKDLLKRDTHCWNCGKSAEDAVAAGMLGGKGAGSGSGTGGGKKGKKKAADKPANLLSCGRCRVAKYCSAECQKAHWKAGHKQACEHLAEAAVKLPETCPCCGHVMDKDACFKAACRKAAAAKGQQEGVGQELIMR